MSMTPGAPIDWAKAACDAVMAAYTPEELPPAGKWHYHQGVFLTGAVQVWERTGDVRYFDYTKRYVDHLVDELGNVVVAKGELDAIQAGLLLFTLEDATGDSRYREAARKLRALFDTFNRTREGGFWHKDHYPYQMWLDGLYMGGVFAARYAARYGEPELVDMALHQERLMRRGTLRPDGLLVHAWDESRRAPWADPATGMAPEVWGRALGWYGVALAEIRAALPEDHPARVDLAAKLGALAEALVRHQDVESGLWYQVVDKGDQPDNWLELSCSSLFVYVIAEAVRCGAADPALLEAARRGFAGITARVERDAEGRLVLPDICIGTGVGDYAHYIARPVSRNDLHGVGTFVWACMAMDRVD